MRLYRATYRDRTGTTRESAKWYLEWRDDGRARRLPAFTDKAASAELGGRSTASAPAAFRRAP